MKVESLSRFVDTEFCGAKPLNMIKNILGSKLHSFVAIPLLLANIQFGFVNQGGVVPTISDVISSITESTSQKIYNKEDLDLLIQAKKIDNYFEQHDLPLTGYGMKFALEAKNHDLPPYLLPAIAMRETTGGQNLCKNPKGQNNPFGYGSCKIGFDSFDHAIEVVAINLAGKNPRTAFAYADKTVEEKLRSYNPPTVKPKYVDEVKNIMEDIENDNV